MKRPRCSPSPGGGSRPVLKHHAQFPAGSHGSADSVGASVETLSVAVAIPQHRKKEKARGGNVNENDNVGSAS